MFMLTIVFLLLINGCSTTKTTIAAATPLAAIDNYSNMDLDRKSLFKNTNNFDIHIITNDEEVLVVPCYYWTIMNSEKN